MVQFRDLNQLQRYLESNANKIFNDQGIEKALASTMSKAVHDAVYSRYAPVEYLRRGNDGGLSDVRNMKITKVEVSGGKVRVLFENLTMGQDHFSPIYEHDYDSMRGQFITDVINDGDIDGNSWYRQGKWSERREFVEKTIESIKSNPRYLMDAIKSAYKKAGFEIK